MQRRELVAITMFAALKKDFEDKTVIHNNHGETLLWLRKGVK
jgi:hypothetical protein